MLKQYQYIYMYIYMQVPEKLARRDTAIWHDANEGKIELTFEVDSIREAVEKFFHNEFKSRTIESKEESDGAKQVNNIILTMNQKDQLLGN